MLVESFVLETDKSVTEGSWKDVNKGVGEKSTYEVREEGKRSTETGRKGIARKGAERVRMCRGDGIISKRPIGDCN
jgi:hypothetical protein